jgi:hypothetical protein
MKITKQKAVALQMNNTSEEAHQNNFRVLAWSEKDGAPHWCDDVHANRYGASPFAIGGPIIPLPEGSSLVLAVLEKGNRHYGEFKDRPIMVGVERPGVPLDWQELALEVLEEAAGDNAEFEEEIPAP